MILEAKPGNSAEKIVATTSGTGGSSVRDDDPEQLAAKLRAGGDESLLTNLQGANLQGANLQGANLQGANLQLANLQGANLKLADLQGANLGACVRTELLSIFPDPQERRPIGSRGTNLQGAKLQGAKLQKAILEWAVLEGANLRGAHLQGANLQHAHLQGANLQYAHLQGANLLDVSTSLETSFAAAHLDGTKVRAHTVVDIEGLTDRQRMRLDIHDSLAQLRRDYSGFWLWFHIVALAAFLSPYLAVIARATIATALTSHIPESASPLWIELLWYILSAGGSGRHISPWCLLFLFGIIYNGLRAALLYKTHQLYLRHQITGLPLTYVIEHDRSWHTAYALARRLLWINAGVAVWHIMLLLSEPVVLTPIK